MFLDSATILHPAAAAACLLLACTHGQARSKFNNNFKVSRSCWLALFVSYNFFWREVGSPDFLMLSPAGTTSSVLATRDKAREEITSNNNYEQPSLFFGAIFGSSPGCWLRPLLCEITESSAPATRQITRQKKFTGNKRNDEQRSDLPASAACCYYVRSVNTPTRRRERLLGLHCIFLSLALFALSSELLIDDDQR